MITQTTDLYGGHADLEHGWQPDTPLTDTVQRRSVLALAESTATPSEAMGARAVRTDDLVATNLGARAGYWNAAVTTRPLDHAGWERVLSAIAELESSAAGEGTVDLWSPFPTPDLRDRGWDLAGHPVAMWRPAGSSPGDLRSRMQIERVGDAGGIAEWAEAAVAFYPLDAEPAIIATPALLGADDVHLMVGRVDGEVVATSATVIAHGTNAVAFIATRPDVRGHGHGRSITQAASTIRSDLASTLLASDEGRPLYEDMGYLPHSRWTMWIRPTR